jgi:hypothetical protein
MKFVNFSIFLIFSVLLSIIITTNIKKSKNFASYSTYKNTTSSDKPVKTIQIKNARPGNVMRGKKNFY